MKAYDLLIQAETGLAGVTGHPAGPGRVGVSVSDIACGMFAYSAVLEALIGRAVSGTGRGIAVSLFDGTADWMNVPLLYAEGTGRTPLRMGLEHPSICPYGAFPTADGSLVLISIQNEREWATFCAGVLNDPALPLRPGFESNNARVANRATVNEVVGAALGRMSRAEVAERLRETRIAFGFVNTLSELAAHPALRRIEVGIPGGGMASIVAPPAIHDGATPVLGPIPAIGEHDAAIRAEFHPKVAPTAAMGNGEKTP
jgi:crotonobetainyl-CoA:carnitine CoA-transferase CaiB-like acyl-CoA transferase